VRQLYDRVTGLLRDLPHGDLLGSTPGRRLILVTHGGPIGVAGAYLAGLGAVEMTWTTVPDGSIVAVSPAQTARCRSQPMMRS
jgi:broad specificity phosphatase PhoE